MFFALTFLTIFGLTNAALQVAPLVITDSDEEVIRNWKASEKDLADMIKATMEQVTSMVVNSDLQLSDECSETLLEVIFGVRDLKLWALKLLDASGKPPSGLLRLSGATYGDYDMCLSINASRNDNPFLGQYCLLDFSPYIPAKPPIIYTDTILPVFKNASFHTELFQELSKSAFLFYNGKFRWAVCLPSTCSKDDVSVILNYVMDMIHMRGNVYSCESVLNPVKLDTTLIVIMAIFIILVAIVLFGTALDIIYDMAPSGKPSFRRSLAAAISIKSNWYKLASPGQPGGPLKCLNGLRFITMVWIVVCHGYSHLEPGVVRFLAFYIEKMLPNIPFYVILNGHLAVVTFLFITAVLTSTALVKAYDTMGPKIFNVPILILHRVLRLGPVMMLCVGLMIILPYFGSGPMWDDVVGKEAEICRRTWWMNLLFINNYAAEFGNMCLLHSWYIATDLQLYVVAIIYLVVYLKNPTLGKLFAGFLISVSILTSGLLTYVLKLPPTILPNAIDRDVLNKVLKSGHHTFHANLAAYVIGLITGTYLARKPKFRISKVAQVIGWTAAAACSCLCLFSIWLWSPGRVATVTESVSYSSLHRTGWALSLSWFTLMCATGRGGYVAELMSWNGYTLVNRLSFLIYLTHFMIFYYYTGTLRGPVDFSYQQGLWISGGTFVISICVSYILRLLFEAPLLEVEKLLLGRTFKAKETEVTTSRL